MIVPSTWSEASLLLNPWGNSTPSPPQLIIRELHHPPSSIPCWWHRWMDNVQCIHLSQLPITIHIPPSWNPKHAFLTLLSLYTVKHCRSVNSPLQALHVYHTMHSLHTLQYVEPFKIRTLQFLQSLTHGLPPMLSSFHSQSTQSNSHLFVQICKFSY